MTLKKPDGNDGTASDVLHAAVEHYDRAIGVFRRATNRIETGQDTHPTPDNDKLAQQFGNATNTLFKEKQKLENSIKKDAGIVYNFALDLEGAREEIRRRLACLRDSRDTGSVSE